MNTKEQQVKWARRLCVGGLLLLLPLQANAWEPNAEDHRAAIKAGDLTAHFGRLTAWLDRKVPTDPSQISTHHLRALLRDRVFIDALAERHFMSRVWGPHKGLENINAFAKADLKNKAFLAWVMGQGVLMDDVMLTRTPSAMFARIDDSHSIDIQTLENWKNISFTYPEARKGLYLRLAVATVLRPPGTGNRRVGAAPTPETPLTRFKHFLDAHKQGELRPSFDTLST